MNHFINNGFRGAYRDEEAAAATLIWPGHIAACVPLPILMQRGITQSDFQLHTHTHADIYTHTHTHTHTHTYTLFHTVPPLARRGGKAQIWMTHSQNGSTYTVTSTTRQER